jgi:hypothetical protein
MIQVFDGIVKLGDPCRVDRWEGEPDGAVWIGDRDLVTEVEESFEGKTVTIGIMDEQFDGELFIETGWGYSEWTPMDSDQLHVGGHDILAILERYEGQHVKVVVSDEKVNLLEI